MLDITKTALASSGGVLIASGSGLIKPIDWISAVGLNAENHLAVGATLCFLSVAMHIAGGGNLVPFIKSGKA